MSRSGYTDEGDDIGLWRANIARATYGKRGQVFFRSLLAALDAMPEKRLVSGDLETEDGEVCALGALRRAKALPLDDAIADSDWDELGKAFAVAPMLCQEVMFENDQDFSYNADATPEARWERMRGWVAEQIRPKPDELRKEGNDG